MYWVPNSEKKLVKFGLGSETNIVIVKMPIVFTEINCIFCVENLSVTTLEYLINREKLIAVHNMEHPQKVNSQEANNCLFLDIFYLF